MSRYPSYFDNLELGWAFLGWGGWRSEGGKKGEGEGGVWCVECGPERQAGRQTGRKAFWRTTVIEQVLYLENEKGGHLMQWLRLFIGN